MSPNRLRGLLLAWLLLALSPRAEAGDAPPSPASPPSTEAKKVDDAVKAEAAARFERGLKLFNGGDNAGALAEFKRIHEIMPNAIVLYNLGLVYAAMGRSVDAVDALEAAIATGGTSLTDLERAKLTLTEQRARVGRLIVTTKPEGALIEVDSVQVASTPLLLPIRVSQGTHIIGAVAQGFAPARKEVVVAGNSEQSLHLELVPTQTKQLANLFVKTSTLGVEVLVDGKVAGKTPLSTTVGLVPGRHKIEARRPGYVTLRREVEVAEGATGEFAFELRVDPAALASEGATLVLDPSESPVELTVDGERKGVYTAPLRVPRGPHRLSVAAAGFVPLELNVNLDGSVTNLVGAVLEPTAETRERYESSANFHRTWGWVGIIGGALIGGTGATLTVMGSSKLEKAEKVQSAIDLKLVRSEPPCDHRNAFEAENGSSAQCDKERADAQKKVDSAKTLKIAGFVGIGVGAAVAVSGVVLLLTGDDPDRYERNKTGRAGRPMLAITSGPGDLGAGLGLSF